MHRAVVFVGGSSGAGKTSLCSRVAASTSSLVIKPGRMLEQVSGQPLLTILPRFDELIETAARHARLLWEESGKAILLVDCHYAIERSRVLRMRIPAEDYVPDLDPRFVQVLSADVRRAFVLLRATPDVALERVRRRGLELERFTLDGLRQDGIAEQSILMALFSQLGDEAEPRVIPADDLDRAELELRALLREFDG